MIIDTHQHFWKYDPLEFDWIDDELAAIRKDFLPGDLLKATAGTGVEGVISVQARQSQEETSWLLELAASHHLIKGVVGWLPLAGRDIRRLLDLYAEGLSASTDPSSSRATIAATEAFAAKQGWRLSDEQVLAVTAIVDGTDAIALISGVGGSGKTSVLAAANNALKARRRGMLVTSTATIAASTAGDASGAQWMNLAALRRAIWRQRPIDARVIVVDEASMADVQSIADVADWCAQTGRRLILQGDHRQLRAVGAGDAYNTLCTERPDRVIRLSTNQRQRTYEGRAIANALHERDVDSAWQVITDSKAVVVARNREHKLTVLAATVANHIAERGADQVTCDAVTNAEVDDLNQRIHDRLIASGTIDPETVVRYRSGSRARQIGAGTVLRVTRPTGAVAKEGARLVRGCRSGI